MERKYGLPPKNTIVYSINPVYHADQKDKAAILKYYLDHIKVGLGEDLKWETKDNIIIDDAEHHLRALHVDNDKNNDLKDFYELIDFWNNLNDAENRRCLSIKRIYDEYEISALMAYYPPDVDNIIQNIRFSSKTLTLNKHQILPVLEILSNVNLCDQKFHKMLWMPGLDPLEKLFYELF